MEDSMELPSEIDPQQNNQINFYISPNNSQKKKKILQNNAHLQNTASQQSLAYSSQTHQRYQTFERSPVHLPNFQSSQRPANLLRVIRAGNGVGGDRDGDRDGDGEGDREREGPLILETRSQAVLLTREHNSNKNEQQLLRQDGRKTINKKQYTNISISRKYKQLEYALQVEVINCQELRTKVSILTELLEHKIRSSDLLGLLAIKNSSRNLRNVDLFLEFKYLQKKLAQANLTITNQKAQLQQLTSQKQNTNPNTNPNTNSNPNPNTNSNPNPNPNSNSIPTEPLQSQIQSLTQQKESLFTYIEQLRKQYKQTTNSYKQLQQEIQRYQEKENIFVNVERPKIVKQLSERALQVRKLEEQVQRLNMENNLLVGKLQAWNQEQKKEEKEESRDLSIEGEEKGVDIGVMTVGYMQKNSGVQTQFEDLEMMTLKAQLKLLKTQRDYYIQQFKKRASQSSQNYILKLQLKAQNSQTR